MKAAENMGHSIGAWTESGAHLRKSFATTKITIAPKIPPPSSRYRNDHPMAASGNREVIMAVFVGSGLRVEG